MCGTANKHSKSQQPDLMQWGTQNTNTLTAVSSVLKRFLQCCPHGLQIQGNLIPVGSQSTLFLSVLFHFRHYFHLLRLYRAFSVESDFIISLCPPLRMSPITTTSTRIYDSPSLLRNVYRWLFRGKQTFECVELTPHHSVENKNAYIHYPPYSSLSDAYLSTLIPSPFGLYLLLYSYVSSPKLLNVHSQNYTLYIILNVPGVFNISP
jgi:hypothetical protein